jgi:hemerythrin-like domain-containing protein
MVRLGAGLDADPMDSTDQHTTHQHSSRCWWNHHRGSWACPSASVGANAPDDVDRRPLVDVRDMLVVHTALLREFRLASGAVCRVALGEKRQAARVERHLDLICGLLHHHHAGEDELLWPPLRARLPESAIARLDAAEAQHGGIEQALDRVGAARARWIERLDTDSRSALAEDLQRLHQLLAEHLDHEERTLLPLAAAHLTAAEWTAIGAAGAAGVPKSAMPLVIGMFAYEGHPEVLATMLSAAPAVPRIVIPRIAPRAYARHATRIHGTPRP